MTTAAQALGGRPDYLSGTARAGFIDRWIYVFTAASFVVITFAGFIPDSLMKVGLVQAGQRPPFPLVLHFHAVLMGSFLMVLLAQTTLAATGQIEQHRKLGVLGAVLAAALVVVGMVLVPTMYHQIVGALATAPPPVKPQIEAGIHDFENIMLLQFRIGILFPVLLAIGLLARKTDPGLHKRMVILAVAPALAASVDRISWLPTTLPTSPLGSDLWVLACISPMLLWDVARNRSVHRAYLIAAAVAAPFVVFVHYAWEKPWWHATAKGLMG